MIVVAKIGTSSLTDDAAGINNQAIRKLCDEIARTRSAGHDVVLVTSGAITAGLPAMGYTHERPKDTITLQAASAVGQSRLLRAYDDALSEHDLIGGQVLLSPHSFFERRQYLHARDAFTRLLQLGIIPIVNENDVVADDEIRFGDNDRIAALVAHIIGAELLVLLTDTAGVFTTDPRFDSNASLIEEIADIDNELQADLHGAGSARGSGGMASKVAAARMASWSGVRTVIAASTRDNVLMDAVAGKAGVGTTVHARAQHLSARKLWIAFGLAASGRIVVDRGAHNALVHDGRSLLAAGIVGVDGLFEADSGVEILDEEGNIFAKGLSRYSAVQLRECQGMKTSELPLEVPRQAVHRDDLVIMSEFNH